MDLPAGVVANMCALCASSPDAVAWSHACKSNAVTCTAVLHARRARCRTARLAWKRLRAHVRVATMLGRPGVHKTACGDRVIIFMVSQTAMLLEDSPYQHACHTGFPPDSSLSERKQMKARHWLVWLDEGDKLCSFLDCTLRAFPEICADAAEASLCAEAAILLNFPPGHGERVRAFEALPGCIAFMCWQYSECWMNTI